VIDALSDLILVIVDADADAVVSDMPGCF